MIATMSGPLAPTEDRLIVERVHDDKTAGGIHMPDNAAMKNQARAKIVAVGPDAAEGFEKGEMVLFVRSGIKLLWDQKELIVLRKGEIIAKLPEQS